MDKEKIILWKRRLLYLPRLFNQREKIIIISLVLLFLASLSSFLAIFITRNTSIVGAEGGAYREGLLKQPQLINPIYLSNNDTDRDLTGLVFSSLINYSPTGEITGDLAEKWEISEDSKTFTFELKKNAFWHDGKKVSSDDIKFTVESIQNPAYKSPQRPNWQGVEVEKIDENHIRFILKQPYAAFLENATIPIIPRHIWENTPPSNAVISDFNLKPIGSGKYTFHSFTTSKQNEIESYTIKANENYHGKKPYISTIQFFFYASENEIIEAIKKKQIDGAGAMSVKSTELLSKDEIKIYPMDLSRVFAIFLNANRNENFREQNIRQALSISIPRSDLINKILLGAGEELNSPFPKNIKISKQDDKEEYDPKKALDLILKSGFRKNENGTLVKKTPSSSKSKNQDFTIKLSTSNAEELIKAAEFVKEKWQMLGINTEINSASIENLEKETIRPRTYEALLFGEVYGHEPDPFSFWHSSQVRDPGLNIAMFANTKTDKILEEARREVNSEKRLKKYAEFEETVKKSYGAIFLYSPRYLYAVSAIVKGIETNNIVVPSDRFNNIENWYIKTKRSWKLKSE